MQSVKVDIKAAKLAAARDLKIDLVVLPELSTTGLISGIAEAEKLCEEIPGNTTEAIAQTAREMEIIIVLGMAEREAGRFYNSSVLIGPGGIVGRHRKVHLTSCDRMWAEAGTGDFKAFDTPFARIGMLIGHDLAFPEAADSLSKLGTDMLCVPALWDDGGLMFLWEARLGDQMHLAIADQWGDLGKLHARGLSLISNYSRYSEKISILRSPPEGDHANMIKLGTKDVREKRFLENIDYNLLLDLKLIKNLWES